MKLTRAIIVASVCLLIGLVVGSWRVGLSLSSDRVGFTAMHTGVNIEQVRALAELVTERVEVADVLETRLQGYTGSIRAAVLVKGDFLLGTDLSRARFESVDNNDRVAVLVLAQPHVTSPRLDHERTKVVAISESGLWLITPSSDSTAAALVDRGYREAQAYIARAAGDSSLLPGARKQAESVLAGFFGAMGWKVTVRWMD